jgi:hypothetical protein
VGFSCFEWVCVPDWQYFYTQYQSMIDTLVAINRIGVAHYDVSGANVHVDIVTRPSQVVFVDFAFARRLPKGIRRRLPELRYNPIIPRSEARKYHGLHKQEKEWVDLVQSDEMWARYIVVGAGLEEFTANLLEYSAWWH